MAINFNKTERVKDIPIHHNAAPEEPAVFVGLTPGDADIDGLELSLAATRLGVSIDEVWRLIRNGKLIARTDRGQVWVYTDTTAITAADGLPPLPSERPTASAAQTLTKDDSSQVIGFAPTASALIESPDPSHRQEIALLIDHLSLAKEENREILRLTHDSMARLSEMTDKMLEMKDSIITSKDEQMLILKQRLSEQSDELRRVLKEKEDLETLTRALQNT